MVTCQELADFEKMPDGVKIDAEVLRKDGFGEEKWFDCLVVEPVPAEQTENGTPALIGYALWFYTYRTWYGRIMYMEDIYVQENRRKHGIGSALWKQSAKIGYDKGCRNIVWSCLDWNKSAICFYEAVGGADITVKEGWHTFRMEYPELKKFIGES
ncbi:thialysine N-epsilon-acetyltransferase-like isoform X2 [Gigantopelta aegis]|uniref:thialysine N-epsilon-acetyltransferase-like isoform X2 n=1 Tax=Gigantopelta aegis TaxID=1735272 RepID=UPI001B88B9CE|nr:thialysine N-epsilon-acetyltransferase-like isoform X2 [Gigantopelta aegis]